MNSGHSPRRPVRDEDISPANVELAAFQADLEHVQENLKRIQKRIKEGGHLVPAPTVRRRYPKSIQNFWATYRKIVNHWFIFNNSAKRPKLVHSKDSFNSLSSDAQKRFESAFLALGRR